jgi:hypothetical protein
MAFFLLENDQKHYDYWMPAVITQISRSVALSTSSSAPTVLE